MRGERVVAGCYAPTVPTNVPCGEGDACPRGQVCELGVCVGDPSSSDAAVGDAVIGGDSDGDGIADVADNCPAVANALQHDHDADARGDDCDLCPHLAATADPDADADGVGDACDPSPADADKRVLWVGFYDSDVTTVNTWAGQGPWALESGTLRASSLSAPAALRPAALLPRAYVASRLLVHSAFVDNSGVSIASGVLGGLDQRHDCVIARDRVRAVTTVNNMSSANMSAWPGTMVPGSTIDITQTLVTTLDCRFTQMAHDVRIAAPTSSAPTGGVYLLAQVADVAFDYLFVVEPAPDRGGSD